MTSTNDMRRDFEAWFTTFYARLLVRNGDSYEAESLGRWTAWQAATEYAAHEAQRQAGQGPVAVIDGIDAYGPRIGWLTHWVGVGVGTKLYAAPRPAIQQAGI